MSISRFLDFATRLADSFIPESIASDKEGKKLARIFLYSHLFGPFIGLTVPLAILAFDPIRDYRVGVLSVSILAFWAFPPILKWTGAYRTLALISVENLSFAILWSCFCYGGVRSPTLAWLLTVPLLSFLYVGASTRLRLAVVGQFVVSAALFYFAHLVFHAPAVTMSTVALELLGLVSTSAATLYVAMMALFYANALASQVELKAEIDGHLRTTSELLAATESARKSSAAKGEFIAKMSHELRTPLNAVIGYSEILLEEAESDKDAQSAADLKRIHSAGVHLLKLVNEILDLSRIEAGRMEVSEELVDCGGLLHAVVSQFEAAAAARNNRIVVDASRAEAPFLVDSAKLRQIVEQLTENAVEFTQGGEVSLSAEQIAGPGGEIVRIAVADTGVGIAPERLNGFFERLETVEEDDRANGGAGVGLLLCKRLAELLGAELSMASEMGKGTRVCVDFPLRATEDGGAADGRALRAVAQRMRGADIVSEGQAGHAKNLVG